MLLTRSYITNITVQWYKIVFLSMVLFCLTHSAGRAQILTDSIEVNQIKKCMGYIYNFRFSEGENISNELRTKYPDSPVPSLIRGMIIYWKNFPLLPGSPERQLFEDELFGSIHKCEAKGHHGDDVEFLLTDLCARGLLLLFYSDNEMNKEVFPLAGSTYRLIRESFHYTDVYPDFLFFTGLYNYYRERYPELYPIYKPFAIFFPRGDAEKGLNELQTAASESIFLSAEASYFLAWIYAVYENDFTKSLDYSTSLHGKYPDNISYQADFIKSLLLEKRYDEAEKLVSLFGSRSDNNYFKAQLLVFNGILQEKKYHDLKSAAQYYDSGLKAISSFGVYGNEYAAYACFGLSRFYDSEKSNDLTRKYRKMAFDYAESHEMNFEN